VAERPLRVKITASSLERTRVEQALLKARLERAFGEARLEAPAPSVRADSDRALRTHALGVASLCAFLPAALLADQDLTLRTAVRNVLAVLLLTILPTVASANADRAPAAEDLPRARLAHRFSPLAVALLVFLTFTFPLLGGWQAVEAVLVLQAPLALFLHVGRVRWIHLLAAGWGALASLALDDRALLGVVPAAALFALAASLDRGLHVRTSGHARTAPELRVPLAATALAGGIFALAFGAALALLPPMKRHLPVGEPERAVHVLRQGDGRVPWGQLVVVAIGTVLLFYLYRWLKPEPDAEEGTNAPPLDADRPSVEAIDPVRGVDFERWPAGPRRTLVRRYLEHLARLGRAGFTRRPGEGALDVAALVARRGADAGGAEGKLARAFLAARYSPEPVSEALVQGAEEAATAVERALGS
jgi:hypothetical protein